MPRPRPWLVALLLFGATFALYARTLHFPFVEFDDPGYVRDNPHLDGGLTAANVRWAFTSTDYQYNWHPLTWLSHALDVELFGREPGPMHLVNTGLHALAAALLLLALHALGLGLGASACTAVLFALHPLRVESVAWIAQRKDVLAGVFFALTLGLYARYARAPSRARLLAVTLACAAGLMAKPTLVTLPFVLLLVDVWPLGRGPRWREKAPLLLLSAASVALTVLAQQRGGAIKSIGLGARLANAGTAYVAYVSDFLAPHDLAVFYPHPALARVPETGVARALLAWGVVALGLAFAWRERKRWPFLFVGVGWFLGMLVPMIGLVQVGNQARADRYAYLPQIGLELALVFGLAELLRARPKWWPAFVAPALAVLLGLVFRTNKQLATWRSSEELFRHALAVTDGNFVAENQLGLVLAKEERIEEALAHFVTAAALRPGFFEAELNAGLAHQKRGELAPSRAAFERAVAARPASAEAHLALATTLLGLGEITAADEELARALELDPRLADDARARRLGQAIEERR
jgi:tetratricopeptide (TPR) repeat protein